MSTLRFTSVIQNASIAFLCRYADADMSLLIVYFNALLAMLNARQRLRGNLGTNAASTSPFRSSIMKSTSDSDDSTFRMSHIFSKNNRPRDRPQSRIVEGSKSRPPTISIDRLESGLGFSAADCAGTATSDSKFSTFKVRLLDARIMW